MVTLKTLESADTPFCKKQKRVGKFFPVVTPFSNRLFYHFPFEFSSQIFTADAQRTNVRVKAKKCISKNMSLMPFLHEAIEITYTYRWISPRKKSKIKVTSELKNRISLHRGPAGNRTRIICLAGNYANRYTTVALDSLRGIVANVNCHWDISVDRRWFNAI